MRLTRFRDISPQGLSIHSFALGRIHGTEVLFFGDKSGRDLLLRPAFRDDSSWRKPCSCRRDSYWYRSPIPSGSTRTFRDSRRDGTAKSQQRSGNSGS